jgi:uncharacterized membrane protein HdeD (DUF308 family)
VAVFLFLLLLAAIAGVLGAVLKAIVVVAGAVALAVLVAGWLAWRSIRRTLQEVETRQVGGTTTITIGPAHRREPDELGPPDDRY